MKVVFDPRQTAHAPETYFRRGGFITHPEQPQRAILLRDALAGAGHEIVAPADHGLEPLYAVHDRGYVDFFRTAWTRWVEATGSTEAAVPNYHTGRREGRVPQGVIGQLGYYATDTACPVMAGTWEAIYWSAQSAVDAADQVLAGARMVYGLSRPPGHHASWDASNGFCFFNNAAAAARHLRRKFARVAVLDVDTHAGNGTQDIFYGDPDVFYASLHVDPADYPPYYLGYGDETGRDAGLGTTLNLLLNPGDGDAEIGLAVDRALAAIRDFGAEALVVSLGFDMAHDDPLSVVRCTADGFAATAAKITRFGLPTVLVQEGGYLGPSLSDNAVVFLNACDAALAADAAAG